MMKRMVNLSLENNVKIGAHPSYPDKANFGRIRVEKGIFSLARLIKNKRDISLTIVGAEKNTSYKINQSNINIIKNSSFFFP